LEQGIVGESVYWQPLKYYNKGSTLAAGLPSPYAIHWKFTT
jgi:hypothetical protein